MEAGLIPPSRLYKYVGPSGIKILQTRTLRFTRPSFLNDPFEVRPFLKTIGDRAEWLREFENQMPATLDNKLQQLPEQLLPLMPREPLIAQLNSQKPLMLEIMQQVLDGIGPTLNLEFYKQVDAAVGILSLTENPNNLLMWSHYGSSHGGMVLEFDSRNEFFNRRRSSSDEFYHLRKVAYSHKRPQVDLLRTSCLELLLTKSQEWSYEAEWRMMLPIQDCHELSPALHVQAIPSGCLKTIIFGANTSPEFRGEVLKTIRGDAGYSHVRVLFAKLHVQEYAVVFSEAE